MGISAPWRNLPSGMTSSSRPPSAVQSRRASSTSLSDCESQSARRRPRSQWSSTMAATWRPLPAPVPSPSIQPRRNRTGADSTSPSPVTESESTASPIVVAALDGLPSRADAVVGGEVARMGLAREHHALELGVGEEPVGHHALGQHRPVGRHRMRYRGHRAGLHERGRMLDRARNPHHARPPCLVGAGGGSGGRRPGRRSRAGRSRCRARRWVPSHGRASAPSGRRACVRSSASWRGVRADGRRDRRRARPRWRGAAGRLR